MELTSNLSLKKPEATDPFKRIDFNTNADKIDGLAVEYFSGLIPAPEDTDYPLLKIPYAGIVNSITLKSSTGTATCYFKINDTIMGDGISLSTEETTVEYTSSNAFAASDKWSLMVSGNSSAENLEFNIWYART